jgi:hypothetical protein
LHAGSGPIDAPGGAAAVFTWTAGRLDACAGAWPGAVVSPTACLRWEVGTLEGTGSHIAPADDVLRPWVASGPVLRGKWSLPWHLFLDAEGSALVRLLSDRFVFLPDRVIEQVPRVGVSGAGGLGVDFL